jgi:hypothetical protein
MTTPLIQFEGGEVLANLDDRTITGLLIPYGEEGRTNVGRFTVPVEAGAVALPADPVVVGINTDHVRSDGVGRAVRVWEQLPEGIYATFAIANTPEGDAALADAISPTGKRRKLSGEFGPAMIQAGKLVAGHARLWGAALVEAGAFPSAQVLAADTPDGDGNQFGSPDGLDEIDDDEHPRLTVNELPVDITATTRTGESATYTPDAAPAEANPTESESTVTASIVPAHALAGAPVAPTDAPTPSARRAQLAQVFAAVAAVKANRQDGDALAVLAELTDITMGGTNALPGTPTNNVLQPTWVGELNAGLSYVREYIGLGKLGTDISAGGKKGFNVHRGTKSSPLDKFDGSWAGNKTDVKSYNGFTDGASSTRRNFAIAEDIGREFYDLPGGAEVVEAFLRLIIEDYARWSDESALADIITAAGVPIAPTIYPGVDGHDYAGAMGMVLQGILAVKRRKADGRRDVPTFAIVNEMAYEELIYTPKDLIPEFVTFTVNTDGTGNADGKVVIVQGVTGINNSPSVIVGADYAIEFDELPGGPLQIDALDIARGGIDKAVHGYLQTFVVRDEAIVAIGTPDVVTP